MHRAIGSSALSDDNNSEANSQCSSDRSSTASRVSTWMAERNQLSVLSDEEDSIPDNYGPLHFLWLQLSDTSSSVPEKYIDCVHAWRKENPRWSIFFWTNVADTLVFDHDRIKVTDVKDLIEDVDVIAEDCCRPEHRRSVRSFLENRLTRPTLDDMEGRNTVDVLKHYIIWAHGGLFLDVDVRLDGGSFGKLSPLFSPQCRNAKWLAVWHFMGLRGPSPNWEFLNQVLAFPVDLRRTANLPRRTVSLFAVCTRYLTIEDVLCMRVTARKQRSDIHVERLAASTRRWFRAGAFAVKVVETKSETGIMSADCFFKTAYSEMIKKKGYRLRGFAVPDKKKAKAEAEAETE